MSWFLKMDVKIKIFDGETFFLRKSWWVWWKKEEKKLGTKKDFFLKNPIKKVSSVFLSFWEKIFLSKNLFHLCFVTKNFFFRKIYVPFFFFFFFWFSKRDLFDFEWISSFFHRLETIEDKFVTRNNGKENITSFERRLSIDPFLRFFSKNWPDIGRIIWNLMWKGFYFISIFFRFTGNFHLKIKCPFFFAPSHFCDLVLHRIHDR